MALILHLETASPVCSVALTANGLILDSLEAEGEKSHATRLTLLIEDIFRKTGTNIKEIDAISLSLGPGSYTGLRIGTSVAKGLGFALGKPLIGIPTLMALAAGFKDFMGFKAGSNAPSGNILLCPMLDARRMEVYTAFYDLSLNELRPVEPVIIGTESFIADLDQHTIWFFGNGSEKVQPVINHANARFKEGFRLSATYQAGLAMDLFNRKVFLDTAYFEPHYLKEFIATVPKNKVLGLAGDVTLE